MGLRGRPRTHHPDRPATSTERSRARRDRQAAELAELRRTAQQRAYYQRLRDDYETPWHVFDPYNDAFAFTLDVCASAANRKCARYFSEADDGLAQAWGREICWQNPPFSAVAHWMEKAYLSSLAGATVVCLVPARTDTQWWRAWVQDKAEIHWRGGRIKFLLDGVITRNSAAFPAVAAIYRPWLV